MDNERLFIGNIMQRTFISPDFQGGETDIKLLLIKENAILYQTDNGDYVDFEELKTTSDYGDVNEVKLINIAQHSKNGITVMPTDAVSKLTRLSSTCGRFVDSETLQNYNEIQNDNPKSKR